MRGLSPAGGRRIAFSVDLGHAVVDGEVRAEVKLAARRLQAALGGVVEAAQPAIGNTQAMFETLVAMDTDRVGMKLLAQRQGVTLTGWLAELLAAPGPPTNSALR